MHQPFIHMMQRSGDRNSCGYAGGPQPLKVFEVVPIFDPEADETRHGVT